MPVFHKLRGTRENTFSIGDGTSGAKSIEFQTNDAVKPAFRWNSSEVRLEGREPNLSTYAIPKVREETRALPTTVGNYIEIGSFTLASSVFSFHIALLGISGAGTTAKEYFLVVAAQEIAATTVVPVMDTGSAGDSNFALELEVSGGVATLRLRRTAGASAVSVLSRILTMGADSAAYSSLSGTGVSTASGSYSVSVNAGAISYDDALSPPSISAGTVQGAIDFLKASSAGGLIPLSMPGMSEGDFGYVSGPSTLSKTDAGVEGKAIFAGAHVGVSGQAMSCGLVTNAKFSLASDIPSYGDRVFLARADDEGGGAAAGKLTVAAPVAGFVAEVGVVSDIDLVHYPSTRKASVILHPKAILGRA